MTRVFESHSDLIVAGGPVRMYRSGNYGPPVLLLHGGALDTAEGVWHDVVPALSADFRVYAIDFPRHGASRPWPAGQGRENRRGRLDAEFFDGFLDELLDRLALPQTAIVGLSMGAGVGIGYALLRPHRVSALVAIGPGGIGAKRKAQFATWLMLRTPGLLRLTSGYLARRPQALRKSLSRNLTAGEATEGFERILTQTRAEAKAKAAHRERILDDWMIEAYGPLRMRLNYLPALPGLRVRSLWIRGEQDPLVGRAEVAAAAAAARAPVVTIPDAGHVVTLDQPADVARVARRFLSTSGEAPAR